MDLNDEKTYSKKFVKKLNALADFANSHPEGFTKVQAADALGVSYQTMNWMVKGLRIVLKEEHHNLVCKPNGHKQPWLFFLTAETAPMVGYGEFKTSNIKSNLHGTYAVIKSGLKSADKRTKEGKELMIMENDLGALLSKLELMKELKQV